MGIFSSCCKINDNEINIDDTKLHIDDSKSNNKLDNSNKNKIKKDFRTSVGPPVIVGRTVVDEPHDQDNHLDLVPYLN
jgi:hypothetical protein